MTKPCESGSFSGRKVGARPRCGSPHHVRREGYCRQFGQSWAASQGSREIGVVRARAAASVIIRSDTAGSSWHQVTSRSPLALWPVIESCAPLPAPGSALRTPSLLRSSYTFPSSGLAARGSPSTPLNTLFDWVLADDLKARTAHLKTDPSPLWGQMGAAQAAAHCADALEVACGDRTPPRMLIGRMIGWLVKPLAIGDDKPMKRNSPTTPEGLIR